MKDGTYKVKIDSDGDLILSEPVFMGNGYWVSDDSGVTVHGKLNHRGITDALSLMDIEDEEIIGIWENEGITFIDRSYHIDELTEAMEIAKQNNQLAIWDCEKAEAVYL